MRILLHLRPTKSFIYDKNYYHKIHGFIYSLLRKTPYEILHDKPGFKFFCFSNLFPIKDFNLNLKCNLLISSPDKIFIKFIEDKLRKRADNKENVHIGEMEFLIEEIKTFEVKLNSPKLSLISATPIIIRIPEKNYDKYNIPHDKRKNRYVYWRPEHDFTAFLKQLEENIFKKYKEFYRIDIDEFSIFEGFEFNGPAYPGIIIRGKKYPLVGSYWKFHFFGLHRDNERRKILEFAIDCGFGERNTYGFGFVNKKTQPKMINQKI